MVLRECCSLANNFEISNIAFFTDENKNKNRFLKYIEKGYLQSNIVAIGYFCQIASLLQQKGSSTIPDIPINELTSKNSYFFEPLPFKKARKLYFMHSLCMVIILFNRSAFSTYSLKNLGFFVFLCSMFFYLYCLEFSVIFGHFLENIFVIIFYIGTKCSRKLFSPRRF